MPAGVLNLAVVAFPLTNPLPFPPANVVTVRGTPDLIIVGGAMSAIATLLIALG